MSKWPMIPLLELLDPVSRPETVQPEKTYRVLGAHWYAHGLYTKETLTGAEIRASRIFRVEKGDFIYNRLFAWKGSFAVASEENHGCYVSNEFPCFRTKEQHLSAEYLWRYFSREPAWTQALDLSKGGTPTSRNRLKEEAFLQLTIPLPPLAEQRRLVERIDALAAKIAEAKRLRSEANTAHAAFISSLHTHLANGRITRISDILDLHEDRALVEAGQEYPQIGVKGFGEGLFPRESITANQTTYKSFNRLYAGAVVLSQVKGWEGAIAVCASEFAGRFASPEYRTFRCKPDEVLPAYLSAIVPTPWFWQQLSGLTRGVGARRERIRPELFLEMQLPMPIIKDQQSAVLIFERLKLTNQEKTLISAELDAMLPAILDRAFRGEL